jgi:hypothetical protein
MAVIPAEFGFRGPLTLSPFLVTAFLGAAVSGASGFLFAGWIASGKLRGPAKSGWGRFLVSGTIIGVLQALVTGVLAAIWVWLAITATISGFSLTTPGEILRLVRTPELFLQGWIVGRTVLTYALIVGLVLAPITGIFIYWMVRREKAQDA